MFCEYYQAVVNVPLTWFIGGVLRNEDNLVFERALDDSDGALEFFVPKGQEYEFIDLMNYLVALGYIVSFEKKENRLTRELFKGEFL